MILPPRWRDNLHKIWFHARGIKEGKAAAGLTRALALAKSGLCTEISLYGFSTSASPKRGGKYFQKKAIVEATEESTTITRALTGKPARYIKSKWTEAFVEAGLEPLPMPYQGAVSGPVQAAAFRQERGDIAPGFAGQGIGMIQELRPAKDVLDDLVRGAEEALSGAGAHLA